MKANSSDSTEKIIQEIIDYHQAYFEVISAIEDELNANQKMRGMFINYFFGKLFADGYVNFSDMIRFDNISQSINALKSTGSIVPNIILDLRKHTKTLNKTDNVNLNAYKKESNLIEQILESVKKTSSIIENEFKDNKSHTFSQLEEFVLIGQIFSILTSQKEKEKLLLSILLELIIMTYEVIDHLSKKYAISIFADDEWRDMFDSQKDFLDKFLFVSGNDKFLGLPNIKFVPISKASDLIDNLPILHTNNLYYRGQGDLSWFLIPSINRSKEFSCGESILYNQILIRCPEDFQFCKSHLDYIVKMQHYDIPTRLIDITSNPLVALFFACKGSKDKSGEVIIFNPHVEARKYEKSDTISLLASLPLFSFNEQEELYNLVSKYITSKKTQEEIIEEFNKELMVQRFLQEVKTEKPAFRDIIIPIDLVKNLSVTPAMKNARIDKQSGAFIVTGLTDHNFRNQNYLLNNMRYRLGAEQPIYIVLKNKKDSILNELDRLNINDAFLFPEIQEVAKYLVNKFTR